MSSPEENNNPFAEREKEIVEKVMQKIDADKTSMGSYYGMVPADLQSRVRHMAEDNYQEVGKKLNMDYPAFREAIARNWLAKKEAFGQLAELYGMRRVESIYDIEEQDRNNTALVMLTRSASYLLVGEGAFDRKGPGASVVYEKIPLREGEELHNINEVNGGMFNYMPQVGDRAVIKLNNLLNEKNEPTTIKTSSVLVMYARQNLNAPQLKSQNIEDSFLEIDAMTLH